MSKEEIKTTYTAANGFAMPTTVNATPKTEKDHHNCGTPDCCGECESDTEKLGEGILKDSHPLKAYEDNRHLDEEFTNHCEQFFKGRAM